jgi:hypothetical protein
LSVRPNASFINARSRSITTQSIAFSRPSVASSVSSFRQFQRRWNSDEAAKIAAEKAETKVEEGEASLEAALEAAAMEAAKEQGSTVDATAAEAEIESTEQVSAKAQEGVAGEVDAQSFSRTPSRRLDNVTPSPTIFIGNLFFDVTAEDLKARMEEYGVVEKATIISDARGLSKGLVACSARPFLMSALY